jgi:hypothetical protein
MIIFLSISAYYAAQLLIFKNKDISDLFGLLVMSITILFTIFLDLLQDFRFHQVKQKLQGMFKPKVMVYFEDEEETFNITST